MAIPFIPPTAPDGIRYSFSLRSLICDEQAFDLTRALRPTIRSIYADGNTVIIFFDASGTARDVKP
jgi:hypothetical protein